MMLWKSRSKLPIAVEATLIYSKIKNFEESPAKNFDEFSARIMYSTFFTRFTNTFVDVEQTQYYARPISAIAEKLDVPLWIVQIRHESTHGALPSYEEMKSAGVLAFEWLQKQYWKAHFDYLNNLKHEISNVLLKYKRYLKEYLVSYAALEADLLKNTQKRAKNMFSELPLLMCEDSIRLEIFRIFLKPPFIISRKCPSKAFIKGKSHMKRSSIWLPWLNELSSCIGEGDFSTVFQILFKALYFNCTEQSGPLHDCEFLCKNLLEIVVSLNIPTCVVTKSFFNACSTLTVEEQENFLSFARIFFEQFDENEKVLNFIKTFEKSASTNAAGSKYLPETDTLFSLDEKQKNFDNLKDLFKKRKALESHDSRKNSFEPHDNVQNDQNASDWFVVNAETFIQKNIALGQPIDEKCTCLFEYLKLDKAHFQDYA